MHATRRHALTLLETVLAVAIVGLVAASMFGTIDFLLARQVHQERTLAAMELANRLMLQYLDDPKELKDDEGLPLRYHTGPEADLYRWEMEVDKVRIDLDEAAASADDDAGQSFDDYSLKNVRIRVWLAEQSGGTYRPQGSPVLVELTRLVDPAAMRTPEQATGIWDDPERLNEMIRNLGGPR